MRTTEKRDPVRWRGSGGSKYGVMRIMLAVLAGLLLTAGLSMTPAQASVTALKGSCTATTNSDAFWGHCLGTGPTSYRAVAFCQNQDLVFGIEHWDGDTRGSVASCLVDNFNSTLNSDWGYLLCSNSDGNGTYQGYINKHGDISLFLYELGQKNIQAGGNFLCDYDTSGQGAVNPLG